MPKEQPARKGSKVLLSASDIHKLDNGLAEKMIDKELLMIFNDLADRGNDRKPRKLCIEVDFVDLDRGVVAMVLKCQAKLPPNVGNTTKGRTDKNAGAFTFRSKAADNPDQTSFEDIIDDDEQLNEGK